MMITKQVNIVRNDWGLHHVRESGETVKRFSSVKM